MDFTGCVLGPEAGSVWWRRARGETQSGVREICQKAGPGGQAVPVYARRWRQDPELTESWE